MAFRKAANSRATPSGAVGPPPGHAVAEIAASAGVSVKTLFQHFRSKEDLLFGEEDVTRDQIIGAIRNRPPGATPLDAVSEWLHAEARRDPRPDSLEAYHRTIGASPAIALPAATSLGELRERGCTAAGG